MRRKLMTIVAADVVGYSRILSEDESGTLSALEMLRTRFIEPKSELHGGQIFRFIGDGTLLVFDSALGAVEFATEVQRELAAYNNANPHRVPSLLRMGINLGDIVVENDDMHGEGVNIAVRLEALAEPGGICVADSVYSQVKQRFSSNFFSIGLRSLKNIVDPVLVWRWRPASDVVAVDAMQRLEDGSNGFKGQHIIDPKVVDVLLRVHARSALLAVSDALDAITDEDGEAKYENFYSHLGEEIHTARSLLNAIKVERIDDRSEYPSDGDQHQTMGEFVSSALNDSKIGYAFKIVPEAQAIMAANDPFIVKRKRLLDLVRRYHNDDFIKQSQTLIKYVYMD